MALTNYQRGRNKEYRIVNRLKDLGYIAFRSAGSHSPIDVVAIHPEKRIIRLIQSKLGYLSPKEAANIKAYMDSLTGTYTIMGELYDDNVK